MLFEDLLILLATISAIGLIGIPIYKLTKEIIPAIRQKNPVAEAKVRLETAKYELEAARLNKEAEKLYEQMYSETLEEESDKTDERNVK